VEVEGFVRRVREAVPRPDDREDVFRLQQRELPADAVAGAAAEREVREAGPVVSFPPVGVDRAPSRSRCSWIVRIRRSERSTPSIASAMIRTTSRSTSSPTPGDRRLGVGRHRRRRVGDARHDERRGGEVAFPARSSPRSAGGLAEEATGGVVLERRFPVVGHQHPLDVGRVREDVRLDGSEVHPDHVAVGLDDCGQELEGVASVLSAVAEDGFSPGSRRAGLLAQRPASGGELHRPAPPASRVRP
jgi:hypothetical protein